MDPNEDTEFNDALRKYGILPPREATPPSPSPPSSPTLPKLLSSASPSTLQSLSTEADDSDTERLIAGYRKQRIAEIKKEQRRARFGSVVPIGRDDYTREVSEASKVDEEGGEGKGTGVVCFLYRDGDVPCARLASQLRTMAVRYPQTKFVSIIGNKCIENFPDRHLPALFMYRRRQLVRQAIAWGADKESSLEELESLFVSSGVIIPSDLQKRTTETGGVDSEDDEEEEIYSLARKVNARKDGNEFVGKKVPKNLRGPASDEDDDSDFDL